MYVIRMSGCVDMKLLSRKSKEQLPTTKRLAHSGANERTNEKSSPEHQKASQPPIAYDTRVYRWKDGDDT